TCSCEAAGLKKAAGAAAMGRFYNCGQACLAIKRVYVFESVADEVIAAIAGKAKRLRLGLGTDEGAQIGPMHTERQRAIMEDQIARTLAGGGEPVAGGRRPGDERPRPRRVPRPPLRGAPPPPPPRRRAGGGGVSGGALRIWRVKDFDRAIERANDSPFGLGSSVWTASLDRAERAAAEIHAGYTWINSPTKVYDELPFGGVGGSGYGKE